MKRILFILIVAISSLACRAQTLSSDKEEQIFIDKIDIMPEYYAGMDKFYERLSRIPYTFLDRMGECQGRVMLMMVVEPDGTLSNLKVLNGISPQQDKEILRVAKRLNKWKPGMQHGKPVRVLCSTPINFKIKES